MNQEQKNTVIQLIQDTLGIENPEEIYSEAEFIADLNASTQEIKLIIDQIQEKLETELEINQSLDSLTVDKLFELIEESLI